ncbi:50S ribosomal protein L24 [Candidatus Uhrbacteria bacterium]|nr:50S ribosomal protein L24 [Candidatus Uhrbacteria bacterium]
MRIKKGDTVKMMGGKDRGKAGKITRVLASEDRLVVEGLNIVKKHRRPRRQGEAGQIAEFARAIPASRVMLICPQCGKPTRVGVVRSTDGSATRRCHHCQATFA